LHTRSLRRVGFGVLSPSDAGVELGQVEQSALVCGVGVHVSNLPAGPDAAAGGGARGNVREYPRRMKSRHNDDPTPIPEDEDPDNEEFTDGHFDIQQEANIDNLMKGS
jgi:hypothetical protein